MRVELRIPARAVQPDSVQSRVVARNALGGLHLGGGGRVRRLPSSAWGPHRDLGLSPYLEREPAGEESVRTHLWPGPVAPGPPVGHLDDQCVAARRICSCTPEARRPQQQKQLGSRAPLHPAASVSPGPLCRCIPPLP